MRSTGNNFLLHNTTFEWWIHYIPMCVNTYIINGKDAVRFTLGSWFYDYHSAGRETLYIQHYIKRQSVQMKKKIDQS